MAVERVAHLVFVLADEMAGKSVGVMVVWLVDTLADEMAVMSDMLTAEVMASLLVVELTAQLVELLVGKMAVS